MEQGIIVGCDQNQEWLLPWWWKCYSAHNSFPVAFMDFGMSEKALAWCKQRGVCVDLTTVDPALFVKEPSCAERKNKWEARYGEAIWATRLAWFKKPFACLYSPFPLTLWIDLDCQVRGSLAPMFNCLGFGAEIAIRRESDSVQELHQKLEFLLPGEVNYNSGVIAFRKNGSIVQQWIEQSIQYNDQHLGDQQALSRAIFVHNPSLIDLPDNYNWSMAEGFNDEATIHHFHGGNLKLEIIRSISKEMPEDLTLPLSFDPAFH
jgi:hypothetical protein